MSSTTSTTARRDDARESPAAEHVGSCGVLGDPGMRLLAGPRRSEGMERLRSHRTRLGQLELGHPDMLLQMIADSGLLGRGGGQFPIARKLELAATSRGHALVVVNASEGEPASEKDRTLLGHRPHLVLDGAMAAAWAVGAREVVVYLHRARRGATAALELAVAERRDDCATVRLVDAPMGYVAGESSAVVSFLDGTGAIPRKRALPAAAFGVAGRPTVVNNVETIAHLGLIARFGPAWFAEAGDRRSPGSTLVTIAGEVPAPGTVAEVVGTRTIGQALGSIAQLDRVPKAVLIGGYEGTWLDGETAWETPLTRGPLAACGASLGCGVLAVLAEGSCGLRTTALLVRWLAGESAGQCGPCVFGLPTLADTLDDLARGCGDRRDVRRLRILTASVHGRGACGHPTGVASLVDSALDAFAEDVDRHARGRACEDAAAGFPLRAKGLESP
jgi:NADH:ubiquinone oxidoreductase subunit F (NADH-binding)